MTVVVVVDALYGDAGKGKVGAYLTASRSFEYSVAGPGGPSGAHTVAFDDGRACTTRQLPTGWIRPETRLRIGPGTLVSVEALEQDMSALGREDVASRLRIDRACGLVQARHVDEERVSSRIVSEEIGYEAGTTAARAEYVWRNARRCADVPELSPYVADVVGELNEAARRGADILVHGDGGTLISLYLGDDYPYTTSTDCTVGAATLAAGLAWSHVDEAWMVFKALPTRNDAGALPREIPAAELERRGLLSYGSVSGRRRRVAESVDPDAARRAARVNEPTAVAIGCADLLDPRVRGVRSRSGLTRPVLELAERLEERCEAPVRLVSTGPRLGDTVEL